MLDRQSEMIDNGSAIPPCNVGIEGPGCSGKTTLIKQLATQSSRLFPVPEYYELNGRQSFVPQGQQRTESVQREVLARLVRLERQRQGMFREGLKQGRLVLSDRTFFSCIAHDFARGQVEHSINWLETQRIFSHSAFRSPELILYLTTPETVRAKYADKIGIRRESMTRNPIFLNRYREFFETYVSNQTKVVFVTSMQAQEIISALLADKTTGTHCRSRNFLQNTQKATG